MTALPVVGGGLPLALRIPNVVEQAGSIAGFAAVIGLAVLSALYFSQARDLRRLREWAGRAPERAAELGGAAQQSPVPGRVVATPQQRPAPPGAQGSPGTQVAPAAGVGGVTPATTAAAATVAKPGAAQPEAGNGDGAPSLQAGGAATAGDAHETADGAAPAGEGKPGETAASDGGAEPGQDGEAKPAPQASSKPGMPAPASAAAATGAGAKSVSGPAAATANGPAAPAPAASTANAPAAPPPAASTANAPAAPTPTAAAATAPGAKTPTPGAVATPQRPPGSVLPPRTGTLPPVRRLPSSNVGTGSSGPQTSVFGAGSQPPKKSRSRLKVALAVIGVLVLGGAAAVGVPAIVNGSKDNGKPSESSTSKTSSTSSKKAAVKPGSITVAVLNGTSIPGLAAQIGDRIEAEGFVKGTISNASLNSGQRANSVVMYAKGHQSDAKLVARKLKIRDVSPIDSNSQSIAGDATVVVLVGTDKTS